MHGLIKGISQLANYENNQTVRKNTIDLLNGIMSDINSGIKVWNDFLNKGSVNASPGSYGGWAGFSIEQDLFNLELEARDKAKQASKGQSSLDEPLISLAYSKLLESQTPADACNVAINAMQDRLEQIESLIDMIKTVKPKRQASDSDVKVSTASGKKKSAKKQATKKKIVKKTSAKSSAAKTKSAKKKTVKKKAVKKKTPAKKSTNKKAAKKKVAKNKVKKKTTSKKRK